MPNYTLGKDCTVSIGGVTGTTVRSVSYSSSVKELEVQAFGGYKICHYPIGFDGTVEIEFVDDPGLWQTLENGTPIQISGSGLSGTFLITSINRSEPLDDVVTVRIQAKYSL